MGLPDGACLIPSAFERMKGPMTSHSSRFCPLLAKNASCARSLSDWDALLAACLNGRFFEALHFPRSNAISRIYRVASIRATQSFHRRAPHRWTKDVALSAVLSECLPREVRPPCRQRSRKQRARTKPTHAGGHGSRLPRQCSNMNNHAGSPRAQRRLAKRRERRRK